MPLLKERKVGDSPFPQPTINIGSYQKLSARRPKFVIDAIVSNYQNLINRQPNYRYEGRESYEYEIDFKTRLSFSTEDVLKSLLTKSKPGLTVIDAGTADGTLLKHLKKEYEDKIKVIGISAHDYKPQGLKYGTEYITGINANIETIAERKIISVNSADVIFASNLLQHVTDPLGTLSELYELLKPGGIMIVDSLLIHISKVSYKDGDYTLIEELKKNGYNAYSPLGNSTTWLIEKSVNLSHLDFPVEYRDVRSGFVGYELTVEPQASPPYSQDQVQRTYQDIFRLFGIRIEEN